MGRQQCRTPDPPCPGTQGTLRAVFPLPVAPAQSRETLPDTSPGILLRITQPPAAHRDVPVSPGMGPQSASRDQ